METAAEIAATCSGGTPSLGLANGVGESLLSAAEAFRAKEDPMMAQAPQSMVSTPRTVPKPVAMTEILAIQSIMTYGCDRFP